MKLLLLTHRLPYPPNRGDRIRSYQLLKFLAQRAEVHLGCVADERPSADTLARLRSLCHDVALGETTRLGRASRAAWSLALGQSATSGHFYSPELARHASRMDTAPRIRRRCLLLFQHLPICSRGSGRRGAGVRRPGRRRQPEMAGVCRPCRRSGQVPVPPRGESRSQLGAGNLAPCAGMAVISDAEARLLGRHCTTANLYKIPNGTDLEYFQPMDDEVGTDGRAKSAIRPQMCVFVVRLIMGPTSTAWSGSVKRFGPPLWPGFRWRDSCWSAAIQFRGFAAWQRGRESNSSARCPTCGPICGQRRWCLFRCGSPGAFRTRCWKRLPPAKRSLLRRRRSTGWTLCLVSICTMLRLRRSGWQILKHFSATRASGAAWAQRAGNLFAGDTVGKAVCSLGKLCWACPGQNVRRRYRRHRSNHPLIARTRS